MVGPVWIGDPKLLDLLLSYATLPKSFIPWHSLEMAWGSKIAPIYLLKASEGLQSRTRKRNVAQHCATWLRARGLPDASPVVVEVTHKELMPWVRGRLRTAIVDAKIPHRSRLESCPSLVAQFSTDQAGTSENVV